MWTNFYEIIVITIAKLCCPLQSPPARGWKRAGLAPPSAGLVEKKLPAPGDWSDLASSNCAVEVSEVGLTWICR